MPLIVYFGVKREKGGRKIFFNEPSRIIARLPHPTLHRSLKWENEILPSERQLVSNNRSKKVN